MLTISESHPFSADGYALWLDERQRRRRNGLPLRRSRKNNKNRVPSFFYTTRIKNPLDVAANEDPVFTEDQAMWRGTRVERGHIQSDAHEASELRKWWFSRARKFYSSLYYSHNIRPRNCVTIVHLYCIEKVSFGKILTI